MNSKTLRTDSARTPLRPKKACERGDGEGGEVEKWNANETGGGGEMRGGGGYVDVCRIATKEGERVGVLMFNGLRNVDDEGDTNTSVRAYA